MGQEDDLEDKSDESDGDKQKWEHVGNGACRTKDGGSGTYSKMKGMSAKGCRKACAESKKCQGYEIDKRGRCELHEERLQNVSRDEKAKAKGKDCYNKGKDKGKEKDESSSRNDKSRDKDSGSSAS